MKTFTEIYAHTIEFWWDDKEDREMDEVDKEHVVGLLSSGFVEGELNQYDHETEQDVSGWWRIVG